MFIEVKYGQFTAISKKPWSIYCIYIYITHGSILIFASILTPVSHNEVMAAGIGTTTYNSQSQIAKAHVCEGILVEDFDGCSCLSNLAIASRS